MQTIAADGWRAIGTFRFRRENGLLPFAVVDHEIELGARKGLEFGRTFHAGKVVTNSERVTLEFINAEVIAEGAEGNLRRSEKLPALASPLSQSPAFTARPQMTKGAGFEADLLPAFSASLCENLRALCVEP